MIDIKEGQCDDDDVNPTMFLITSLTIDKKNEYYVFPDSPIASRDPTSDFHVHTRRGRAADEGQSSS